MLGIARTLRSVGIVDLIILDGNIENQLSKDSKNNKIPVV